MSKRLTDGPFGERYGYMIVLRDDGVHKRHRYVIARCDCGNEKRVLLKSLRSGHTKTCGCGTARKGVRLIDSFWARVAKTDFCWLWNGSRCSAGYGQLVVNGRQTMAHRFAWEIENGAIPDGLTVDHLCMNKLCVNPDHMELVTRGENARRHIFAQPTRKT